MIILIKKRMYYLLTYFVVLLINQINGGVALGIPLVNSYPIIKNHDILARYMWLPPACFNLIVEKEDLTKGC